MLLSKDAPLELQKWYRVRAELQGGTMSFYVDDQLIGTVTDNRSPSGAVAVAVQDAEEVLFDDFSVTGPNVRGNELKLSPVAEKITLSWSKSLTNYVLKSTQDLSSSAKWEPLTNSILADGDRLSVTLNISSGNRFYSLIPDGP